MKNWVPKILILFVFFSIFGSCTIQKRRYSSGYHLKFKHLNTKPKISKKAAIKEFPKAKWANQSEKINSDFFAIHHPKSKIQWPSTENEKRKSQSTKNLNIDSSYYQTPEDSQNVLTQEEIAQNYFINKKGEKKIFRKKLRIAMIVGGAILSITPLMIIGIPLLIVGILLPHPTKKSLLVHPHQSRKMTKKEKGFLAVLISVATVILLIVLFIALISLFFAALLG